MIHIVKIRNPILPGFYPDPSICRVDDDFYLVTSTFSFFPGVPIFHSKDLANWEQIGHVLSRPSQLDLGKVQHSHGILAPTLRYHDGVFYLITTNAGNGGNFIVTATDPAGPWSDPYWLWGTPGIDPSLFFDEDGRAYFCGTASPVGGSQYQGHNDIWLQEFDPQTMSLVGESVRLWNGALKQAQWSEAPHIYKKGDYYYLMIAEGGTHHNHSVTIARSKSIWGPYEGNPANPILTHRHLGRDYPIVNVGHGDLVDTPSGDWWIVVLASRPYGGYYRNMGRETFIAPVIWEDGWPIVSPGTGKLEWEYPASGLPQGKTVTIPRRDDFSSAKLDLIWNVIRTPIRQFWDLEERPGFLRIYLQPETINQYVNPPFIGRRQQHHNFAAATALEFEAQSHHEAAGLIVLQSNEYYYRLNVTVETGQRIVQVVKGEKGIETELAREELADGTVYLKLKALNQNYSFYYGSTEAAEQLLFENADGRILTTDVAGGMVGSYVGMYATSHGKQSTNYADFDWFEYHEVTDED